MSSESIRLRPMSIDDIDKVAAIEATIASLPWNHRMIAGSLDVGHPCWLLTQDEPPHEALLAYAITVVTPPEAELLILGVPLHLQRRGYGYTILQHVCTRLAESSIDRLFLEVRPSNLAARTLYAKLRFVQIGIRPDYYPANGANGPREDALILCRALHPDNGIPAEPPMEDR